MIRILMAGACALACSACTTTTSFAPPPVNVQYSGDQPVDFTCPGGGRSKTTVTVPRTRTGTYQLIDTFIAAVRCGAHSAANGRQLFQLPAFVATTGAATAVALGGGATYGILGTTANAVANAGNNYWDPKQKAAIYDHALDALLCIKTAAVGVDAFKFDFKPVEAKGGGAMISAAMIQALGSIPVPVEDQYFMMVSSAVFSVERVLAHRLSNVGSIDASSVVAEIEKAAQARKDAEAKKEDPPEGSNATSEAVEAAADAEPDPQKKALLNFAAALARQQEEAEIDLDVLKPQLDECIVRAKL